MAAEKNGSISSKIPAPDGVERPLDTATGGSDKSKKVQADIEIGGPPGPEPTRYGDWEKGGRCTDF